MRRLIMAAAILSLWTLPAYAQQPDIAVVNKRCCQYGVTYGASTTAEIPTCAEVSVYVSCGKGGKTVSGTCQSDGACSGSEVCCQGVTWEENCTNVEASEYVAIEDSCAKAKESACDAKSAAGAIATQSVPGGTCVDDASVTVPVCERP